MIYQSQSRNNPFAVEARPRRPSLIIAMPADAAEAYPFLPPLLTFSNGTSVTTAAQWRNGRSAEVASLLQEHLLGTLPTTPPALVSSKVLNRTRDARTGALSSFIRLGFDTTPEVQFDVEVLAPNTSEARPLFLTQWNHRQWALLGVSRGYVGLVYPGADTRDVAPAFQRAYRSSENASMALIVARAFVASRALDYALSPRFVTDLVADGGAPPLAPGQVAITGHSRNGKQSLLAAAFDERIAAVVGSSRAPPHSAALPPPSSRALLCPLPRRVRRLTAHPQSLHSSSSRLIAG